MTKYGAQVEPSLGKELLQEKCWVRMHADKIGQNEVFKHSGFKPTSPVAGSAPSSSTSPLDSKPEERQLLKVCTMVLENWKAVCTHLCIPSSKISESEQNNVGDVSQAFFNALLWWREGNCRGQCRPPTWRVLLGSIREAGFPDTAETIQKSVTLGEL